MTRQLDAEARGLTASAATLAATQSDYDQHQKHSGRTTNHQSLYVHRLVLQPGLVSSWEIKYSLILLYVMESAPKQRDSDESTRDSGYQFSAIYLVRLKPFLSC